MSGWSTVAACLASSISLWFAGCDFGPWAVEDTDTGTDTDTDTAAEPDTGPDPKDYRGPTVEDVWPERGATGIPRDAVIRLRMSGHLAPASVTPTVFNLYSGPNSRWITTSYDPVTQELRLWTSPALTRKVEWVLELTDGLLGLDGEKVLPREITRFRTSDELTGQPPIPAPSYIQQVAPLLDRACNTCHNASAKVAGLALDSPENIATTAIQTSANGWPSFVRIEPERPDSSYLIYKIIGWQGIAGQAMPATLTDSKVTPLSAEQQRLLSDWIASGLPFVDPQDTDS